MFRRPAAPLSRTETDRDDLFAEAAAMPRRIECVRNGGAAVVAGLRSDGRASVYFAGTTADHLDAGGRLLRAFRTGPDGVHRLYRTQGDTLAELVRSRSAGGTALLRRDLEPGELAAFLAESRARLRGFAAELRAGSTTAVRSAGGDCRTELAAALAVALPTDEPLAPRYKGKR